MRTGGNWSGKTFRFKAKAGIPLGYDHQGYVYFTCRMYKALPPARRKKIDRLIREVGGEYAEALRAFIIRGENATKIEMDYYCSKSQLYRLVQTFYREMPVE